MDYLISTQGLLEIFFREVLPEHNYCLEKANVAGYQDCLMEILDWYYNCLLGNMPVDANPSNKKVKIHTGIIQYENWQMYIDKCHSYHRENPNREDR